MAGAQSDRHAFRKAQPPAAIDRKVAARPTTAVFQVKRGARFTEDRPVFVRDRDHAADCYGERALQCKCARAHALEVCGLSGGLRACANKRPERPIPFNIIAVRRRSLLCPAQACTRGPLLLDGSALRAELSPLFNDTAFSSGVILVPYRRA